MASFYYLYSVKTSETFARRNENGNTSDVKYWLTHKVSQYTYIDISPKAIEMHLWDYGNPAHMFMFVEICLDVQSMFWSCSCHVNSLRTSPNYYRCANTDASIVPIRYSATKVTINCIYEDDISWMSWTRRTTNPLIIALWRTVYTMLSIRADGALQASAYYDSTIKRSTWWRSTNATNAMKHFCSPTIWKSINAVHRTIAPNAD